MRDVSDKSVFYQIGDLLITETGEYSDYSWQGPVRILKEFSQKEIAELYTDSWERCPDYEGQPEERWPDKPSINGFLAWLVKEGFVEDVPAQSWHIGEYGRFEPEF